MLTGMILENFKCFAERETLAIRPLTLIYGPNSSGKSAILSGLEHLRRAFSRDSEFEPARIHAHFASQNVPVRLGVRFRAPGMTEPRGSDTYLERYMDREVEIGLHFSGGGTEAAAPDLTHLRVSLFNAGAPTGADVGEYILSVGEEAFARDRIHERLRLFFLADKGWHLAPDSVETLAKLIGTSELDDTENSLSLFGHQWTGPEPGFAEEAAGEARGMLEQLSAASLFKPFRLGALLMNQTDARGGIATSAFKYIADEMSEDREDWSQEPGFRAILALRSLFHLAAETNAALEPIRFVEPLRERVQVYEATESGVDVAKQSPLPLKLLRADDLLPRVNQRLKKLELPYELEISQIPLLDGVRAEIVVRLPGVEGLLSLRGVGTGVSQILPVIDAAEDKTRGTIVVEQPELHLHPRQQGHVADMLIESAFPEGGDPDTAVKQWIVETHSEAIIRRVQRRIREGRVRATDVSVAYVRPVEGRSSIIPLRLDERGYFKDEWPNGFFEESFEDSAFGGGLP